MLAPFLFTLAGLTAGPTDVLDGLRPQHPRLLLTGERLADLQLAAEADALLADAVAECLRDAETLLEAPEPVYEKRGIRLLSVSRDVLRRSYLLAFAWRWSEDPRFVQRLQSDLLAACEFPDWNPSHFLDTAEMTHAVGLGYDWTFAALDPGARDLIRAALIEKGLRPGIQAYEGERPAWWTRSEFNWNAVCSGGLLVGALAVAEDEPDVARALIEHARTSLPLVLDTYDPDGAWPEGPGYWSYATRYAVLALAALDSALGTDFDLSERPGLARAGRFALASVGPTGGLARFADVGEKAKRGPLPALLWLGTRYADPLLSTAEREFLRRHTADPLHVVWYAPAADASPEPPPLDQVFGGPVELAFVSSARDDPRALWVAFKAGYNAVNHGHLDLGSFELEALGRRFARDLGRDDYDLPGYWDGKQGGRRWSYFRLRSDSHNLLLPAGTQQAVAARSTFTHVHSTLEEVRLVLAIEGAFPGVATDVRRGLALVADRRAALVQDELVLAEPTELVWGLSTDAVITLDGASAVLTLEGESLVARALAPDGATFEVTSAEREPPERRNAGVLRLELHLRAPAGPVRVIVLLEPVSGTERLPAPAVVPLADW